MSRAFINGQDGESGAGEIQDLPVSEHPNYVTPRGLAQLKERLAAAQEKRHALLEEPESVERELPLAYVAREIRYLETRIATAIPTDPAAQPPDEVAFGATVRVADPAGEERQFTIVGEDEAAAEKGSVSWVSPLARALVKARVGDVITWRRPAGDLDLEILAIRYEA